MSGARFSGRMEWDERVAECVVPRGTGSLLFINDVSAERKCRMNSEEYRAIRSAQFQSNTAQLIGAHFTVRTQNLPPKSFLKQRKQMFLNESVNPMEHAFDLLKTNVKAERNKQQLKASYITAWRILSRRQPSVPGCAWVLGFRQSMTIKGLHPSIKHEAYICNCLSN